MQFMWLLFTNYLPPFGFGGPPVTLPLMKHLAKLSQ